MSNPKWTIASVNWDSLEFLKYQSKFFHEFGNDFEFLIFDNEHTILTEEFNDLQKSYQFVKVFPTEKTHEGFYGHGIGLNELLKLATGKFIFFIDPDFFYIKKNILNFFEEKFNEGCHAVGADYWGDPFPMPWGSAYYAEEIRDLDLRSKAHFCKDCNKWIYDFYYDTAFQIRIRLKNQSFYSFKSRKANSLPNYGAVSEIKSQEFFHSDKIVAYHLKGGSQMTKNENKEDIKRKYVNWMWSQLQD